MAIVTLTAQKTAPNVDPRVEFEADDVIGQGGMKDVYFSRDKSYVVAFYRDPLNSQSRARLDDIVGKYYQNIFNPNANGDYWKNIFCWPDRVVEYNGRVGVTAPTYQKQFFFQNGKFAGKEKNGKWFSSSKLFNRFVPDDEKGTLLSTLRACLTLSRGIRRLHAAGLSHSDLSYNNCLINLKAGEACVIDCDSLVVPGKYPPDVLGTPDFIAPEVVKTMSLTQGNGRELPCLHTDRHALAVLIYSLLFHRHPLRGRQIHSQDQEEQERLEMGERALFIEHPTDDANRLNPDECEAPWNDAQAMPYTILGKPLAHLFRKAFVDGLHDRLKRPSANDWETAFVQTGDSLLPCSNPHCLQKSFILAPTARASSLACPYCGTRYGDAVPILDFYKKQGSAYRPENRGLVGYHGTRVHLWHVDPQITPNEKVKEEDKKAVGYISFHKGQWILANLKVHNLRNLTTGETIPQGKGVVLKDGLELMLCDNGMIGRKAHVRFLR